LARLLAMLGFSERPRLLVLPVASVENHGVLPAGSDYLLAMCVVERLAAVMSDDAAFAPVLAYSTAVEHEALGLTLGAGPTTFTMFLEELLRRAARLAKNAVAALVFHGGAYCPAYMAARAVRRREGATVAVESFWSHVSQALKERYGVEPYPIHADPVEASLLLACGHRVGVEEVGREKVLEEARSRAERLRGLPTPWLGEDYATGLYPTSPVPANRELGAELLEAAAASLAGRLSRLLE